jgi:hypothetical protein
MIHSNASHAPGVFGFPQISQKYAEAMNGIFMWAQHHFGSGKRLNVKGKRLKG